MVLAIVSGEIIRKAIQTLSQLDLVEKERDTWQRSDEVMAALDLHSGSSVEDLGSGAGYFALKLARTVGNRGTVLAVDTRAEPLVFLFIRGHRQGLRAIRTVHRAATDPHLTGEASLDAVLIANTYHEFILPDQILDSARSSLRHDGKLVILDRGPESASDETWRSALRQHEVPSELVQRAVRSHGFDIVSVDNRFIQGKPDADDRWWLMIARKSRD
jgi:SAM-dependent methyltransferase